MVVTGDWNATALGAGVQNKLVTKRGPKRSKTRIRQEKREAGERCRRTEGCRPLEATALGRVQVEEQKEPRTGTKRTKAVKSQVCENVTLRNALLAICPLLM